MTLRWGLIGSGDIVRKRVAPALRDWRRASSWGSVAVAPISRERLLRSSEFAESGIRMSRRFSADPEIDAVYVATPVHLHAEHTIAAAKAGKHVLCEKPMAMNVKECDAMIEACRANGVALGIALLRHMYPAIAAIKRIIASGEIGTVAMTQINAFEYFDPAPDDPRHWFTVKERAGGGPMFDFGCHRLEILVDVFGPVRRT